MKPPLINGRRITCCYCKRQLAPVQPEIDLSLTFDHVRAESLGGWKKVPCCRKCNQLKDNLAPEDWFWFIAVHARWWKTFDSCSQVRAVIIEFRSAQARARGAELKRRVDRIGRRNGLVR